MSSFFRLKEPRKFHLPGFEDSRELDNEFRRQEHRIHFKRPSRDNSRHFALAFLVVLLLVLFIIIRLFRDINF